jgi:stage II sporulation protein D
LTDNTLSQVYGGINAEKEDCTNAVMETKGMVATYNGKIAEVFYFATSSGTTLDVKDVWGSTTYPYLVPVDDSLQSNVIKDNGKWTVKYTNKELTELFNRKGLALGDIIDVNVDEYNKQGAVMKLTFSGVNDSKTYTLGKTRDVLSLKSQTYTISKLTDNGNKSKLSVLSASGYETCDLELAVLSSGGTEFVTKKVNIISKDSNHIVESNDGEFKGIEITGYGYGHGIGMSQNGAKALANSGYTYEQIIKHYFTGVEVQSVQQEEQLNDRMEAF